jgi:hypothetical protein
MPEIGEHPAQGLGRVDAVLVRASRRSRWVSDRCKIRIRQMLWRPALQGQAFVRRSLRDHALPESHSVQSRTGRLARAEAHPRIPASVALSA